MNNIPQVKVGIVAVSRDCFPIELSIKRRKALVEAYQKKYNKEDIYECPICIFESETEVVKSLEDGDILPPLKEAGASCSMTLTSQA